MKRSELFFSTILVPLDWLLLTAAGLLSYGLRFHPAIVAIRPVIFDLPFVDYFRLLLSIATFFVIIFAFSGLYRLESQRGIINEGIKVALACSTGILLVVLYIFWQREFFSSRFIILTAWLAAIVLVSLGRVVVRSVQRLCYRKGVGLHNILLIGDSELGDIISAEYHKNPSLGYHLVGRIKDSKGDILAEVKNLVKEAKVDDILYIDNAKFNNEEIFNLVNWASFQKIDFHFSSDYLQWPSAGVDIVSIAGVPIMEFKKTTIDGWGRIFKRLFDLVVSVVFLLATLPIMFFIAIVIKIDSRGPIFFSALDDGAPLKRVGQFGKPFYYFKFRTMIPKSHRLRYEAEFKQKDVRQGSPLVKIKDDPRVTRAGKFLRRFSLDELPEFFLVLIGKMSLVGPRPHLPEEVAKYQNYHRAALTIKPGITGLAQISGRSDLEFEEEIKLDLYYIKNWSPKLDLQILIKTLPAILRPRQAD